MRIIDKNHLPEDIIEDEDSFYETTYLLFRDFHLTINDIDEYFVKYHKDMSYLDFIDEKFDKLMKYFDNIEDRSVKAMNSTYIRYYMKDLKNKIEFKKMSQNLTKKFICMFITEIIQDVCFQTYENIFKEKYMDIFEESVTEEHLKKEFDEIIMLLLTPVLEGNVTKVDESDYERFCLYRELHSQYIIELENSDRLTDIKKQIQDVFLLSKEEVSQIIDQKEKAYNQKFNELEANFDEKIDNDIEDDEDDEIKESFYQLIANELGKDISEVTEADFENFLSSIDLDEERNRKEEKLMKKLEPIYQQYFMYDENHFFDYYDYIKIKYELLSSIQKTKSIEIIECINFYLFNVDHIHIGEELQTHLEINEECDYSYNKTIDCLHLLAYYLWHRKTKQNEIKRIQGFKDIMSEVNDCYEEFLNLREDPLNDNYVDFNPEVFEFSPKELYYNHIVLSVIMHIDKPIVYRRVKKLIMQEYNNQYDLSQISLNATQLYEEEGIHNKNIDKMCQLADLFIMSYLKDAKTIAIYSPFIRCFEDLYDDYNVMPIPDAGDVIGYLNYYDDCNDLKLRKKIFTMQKRLNSLIEHYHHHKDKLSLLKHAQLESIMNLVGKSSYFFNGIVDYEDIFTQYQYQLISYLCSKDNQFFQLSLEDQLDELIYVSYLLSLMENIDQYEEYMPRKNQIQQDTYIHSLKQAINEKDSLIQIKDQQIENLSLKHAKENKGQNNKDFKLLEKELKCYKQEISALNKQIVDKNKEIEELQKNQEELFKLRNLIFTMQQEDHLEDETSINIEPLIQDKNIVIIGGHIHLRDKLKQKYPSLKILAQSSHINNALLVNADHVFLYYKFMTHDMYNRAMAVIMKNDIPFDYIPYTNLEKSEQIIYQILSQDK